MDFIGRAYRGAQGPPQCYAQALLGSAKLQRDLGTTMPGCVLRAYGSVFDVDGYLANSPFVPCAVFRHGRPRVSNSTRLSDTNGFNLVVSDASGDRIPEQVLDATAFVELHGIELARLMAWPGVEGVKLDFGWDFPCERTVAQQNFFPPSLLKTCGSLGIGIEISVYAVSDASGDEKADPSAGRNPDGM